MIYVNQCYLQSTGKVLKVVVREAQLTVDKTVPTFLNNSLNILCEIQDGAQEIQLIKLTYAVLMINSGLVQLSNKSFEFLMLLQAFGSQIAMKTKTHMRHWPSQNLLEYETEKFDTATAFCPS